MILRRCKLNEWEGESANVAGGMVALPRRHCWRASVLCAALYSENFLSTYNLDYKSIKLVTANIPMRNGRVWAVLWRQCIRQSSGVSGGDVHSQIQVFRAQRIPVPYNIHSLLSSLITGSPSHMTPRALSLARLSLSTFTFAFPPLSLCSIHCIAADLDSYKYPTCGLAERQANRPSLFPFICVHFQATAAPSVSSRLCFTLPRHSSDPIPPITTRHSHLQTCVFRSLVISSPSHLDRHPITHACSSGNNKPRTPLPFTLVRILPSEMSLGFYFLYCALLNSRADSHSAIQYKYATWEVAT